MIPNILTYIPEVWLESIDSLVGHLQLGDWRCLGPRLVGGGGRGVWSVQGQAIAPLTVGLDTHAGDIAPFRPGHDAVDALWGSWSQFKRGLQYFFHCQT